MANQNSENQSDLQQQIDKNRKGDEQLQKKPRKPPITEDDPDDMKPALEDNPEQVENVEGRERAGTTEPDDDPENETGEEDPGSGIDADDVDEDERVSARHKDR
jgi:hypothetical protein